LQSNFALKRLSNPSLHICGAMDCFEEPVIRRRSAPTGWLAMTAVRHLDKTQRSRDAMCRALHRLYPSEKQRAQGKPGADRTHGSRATKSTGGRTTGVTGNNPAFPARWVTAYFVLSPARLGFFVTVFATRLRILRGDTNHEGVRTTRLHRPLRVLSSVARSASTASHRNTRDDREAPLNRVRRANHTLSCNYDKPKYFDCAGLTGFCSFARRVRMSQVLRRQDAAISSAPPWCRPNPHPWDCRADACIARSSGLTPYRRRGVAGTSRTQRSLR
jgi:hypothetical protein